MQLNGDERIDYIVENELSIIQSPTVFSFSLDAILLARFAWVPIKRGKIIDLCTGNGIIPLLLSRKSEVTIEGVEIQDRLF
ncbi:SAM-dependent methyltransferase, partial [Micrococcus sp. SIMBA_131]